ncbi:MAG TPA: ATP-binding protein [Actinomycetota bacterium]|jgi:anti-sigma regulatory factor (Ser/Thr protein kinase)|nr:ATP-binding protein [Actinomycetota bacterium]
MSLESFTTLALPRDLGTPAQGRRLLESALESFPESVLADAQLLLTEVLSNAILHGSAGAGARIDVSVEADESIVRVTVTDPSPQFPRPAIHAPDPLAASGWGLYLLERLATQWGVEDAPDGGSAVWFELRVSRSHPTPPTPRRTAPAESDNHSRVSPPRLVARSRSTRRAPAPF